MSIEVKIPAVGESITSGLIAAWHKNDGDTVNKGDVLLTLETDKVSTELQAESAGVLRIKQPAGAEVKIGETIAVIEESSGSAAAPAPSPEAPSAPAKQPEPPAGKKDKAKAEKPASQPEATSEPEPEPTPPAQAVEPASVSIGEAVAALSQAPAPAPSEPQATSDGRITRKRMSPLRRKIAAQLVMAQQNAAILTTFNEADLSAIIRLRKEMQDAFTKEHGVKLGFMSFFIKAVVGALKAVPQINTRVEGEDVIEHHFYDIGVAVGTERGLVVPVVRDADKKSFADLERELLDFATRARDGKIKIEELQGGVFTISNGGVYGSLLSTPILNPPQSGILGMHKIQERPVAVDGQVVIRPMMYLALSYDHRVVDGKEAVTFLVRVKESLENPARLLLDL